MKKVVIIFILMLILGSCISRTGFDENYWKNTNDFYMVYDMTKSFDESKALSSFEMFRISGKRTKMAKNIIESKKLYGLTKDEVTDILGAGNAKFIIGDGYQGKDGYSNSLQYVIDAEKRSFQFYGESGIRQKYMVVFLSKEGTVISVDIIKQKH